MFLKRKKHQADYNNHIQQLKLTANSAFRDKCESELIIRARHLTIVKSCDKNATM